MIVWRLQDSIWLSLDGEVRRGKGGGVHVPPLHPPGSATDIPEADIPLKSKPEPIDLSEEQQ